jgi:hypothetical protein
MFRAGQSIEPLTKAGRPCWSFYVLCNREADASVLELLGPVATATVTILEGNVLEKAEETPQAALH